MKLHNLQFDSGWLFLLAGCALLWAAIVLPANQELSHLQDRLKIIQLDHEHMSKSIDQYQTFFDLIANRDPDLMLRVIQMQTNGNSNGNFVVLDPNAAKTPVEWLERRTSQMPTVVKSPDQHSMLENLTAGDQRLWVAGFGGLIVFIGLLQGYKQDH
jgi:hypothetical protein